MLTALLEVLEAKQSLLNGDAVDTILRGNAVLAAMRDALGLVSKRAW